MKVTPTFTVILGGRTLKAGEPAEVSAKEAEALKEVGIKVGKEQAKKPEEII
jgi:hypothetical protein